MWKVLPRYWIRRGLGIASSDADAVLTVYDKPLADSPLVKVLKQRVLDGVPTNEFLPPPARWRNYIAAWGVVTARASLPEPDTYENNKWLARLTEWCPYASTPAGAWRMAGVLRMDDLWANENWVSPPKIQAKCRAGAAALTGDTRAAVLHCVTMLEDSMLRELERRVRDVRRLVVASASPASSALLQRVGCAYSNAGWRRQRLRPRDCDPDPQHQLSDD
jgi:hypothetical protein